MIDLPDWRQRATGMEFDGHRIQIYEAGADHEETLLLIHGFPTAAWDWYKLWPHLADRYRLIAPDLLGFGFSDKPRDVRYNFFGQADLCQAALAERGVDRYHILAHDYGDTVAQELLARKNEGCEAGGPVSACLLNGGIFPEVQQPILIQRLLAGRLGPLISPLLGERSLRRSLSRVFGPDTPPTAEESAAFWQLLSHCDGHRILHRLLAYLEERRIHRDRWVSALTDAPVPLMLIDGVLDPVSGANIIDRWRQLLPAAPIVELPGVGHYPQIEAPEAVLNACLPFFASRVADDQ